jgi:hypothetical protein
MAQTSRIKTEFNIANRHERAYGWSDGTGDKERLFAVLEIPPVKSATDAVRASIVADAKGKK